MLAAFNPARTDHESASAIHSSQKDSAPFHQLAAHSQRQRECLCVGTMNTIRQITLGVRS